METKTVIIRLLFSLLLLGALIFISFFLNPNMSDINFLAHSLTIFSISLAMLAFISPFLLRYRNGLRELDKVFHGNYIEKTPDLIREVDEMINEIDSNLQDQKNEEEKQKWLNEREKLENCKLEFERMLSADEQNPDAFSTSIIITQEFEQLKNRTKHCLFMIITLILVNQILFKSPVFSNFIHDNFSFISNLHTLKIGIANFLNLTTLIMQLYFLYQIIMTTMNTLLRSDEKKIDDIKDELSKKYK